MHKVPKGKIVYIGSRRLIEGEALPPYVILEKEIDEVKPKKRSYKSKKRSGL